MKNYLKSKLSFFITSAMFVSCSSPEVIEPVVPVTNSLNYTNNVNLLYTSLIQNTNNSELKLLKNGISTTIQSGTASFEGDMTIVNNDTYIAITFSGGKAGYWKNGVVTLLGTTSSLARGIAVLAVSLLK